MSYWESVEKAADLGGYYGWTVLASVALALILASAAPGVRTRLRGSVLLIAASFAGMLACGTLVLKRHGGIPDTPGFRYLNFGAHLLFAFALINLLGVLLFRILLRPIRLEPAPILRDTILGLAYIIATITLLGRAGADVSGIVATSAVVTAVIGFSLQDTLGNVMGGIALQMEQSVAVGDWVRIGDVEGVVREIRWRQTSIETRNWDTIVIPNSVLMKSQVKVLGRRSGHPRLHRMWVEFNVDFRHSAVDVVKTVERALREEAIPNVAADPPPNCILYHFKESYAVYAVRYWLVDFAPDDATSSEIRMRIVVALQRAGISLSIPAQSVFLTMEGRGRTERKLQQEVERRAAVLKAVALLAPLTDEERHDLAGRLSVAPFREREIITRQGNQAHHLYILTRGEVAVRIAGADGESRQVATLRAGDVFGEMGLMTGEPRTATVVALTDAVCYRLDKESFEATLQRRPEIAEAMSHLLAKRKLELDAATAGLNAQAMQHRLRQTQGDLLQRIRRFFTLG